MVLGILKFWAISSCRLILLRSWRYIRPCLRIGNDFIGWEPKRSGQFSVRSGYQLVFNENHNSATLSTSNSPEGRRNGQQAIWSCPAPPKVLGFSRRLATDTLATWVNKNKRTMEPTDICLVCDVELEDSFHVFWRCPNAKRLWKKMSRLWDLPDERTLKPTEREWFLQWICQLHE